MRKRASIFVLISLIWWGCSQGPSHIDFSAQVKPIINSRCITCHGGVKRNNGFSLLFRQDALDTTESGKPAIIPGDPDHSEMIRRITHSDPEERMPYKENPLPEEEIKILKQWIKEGAQWGDHWAYVPPRNVAIPGSSKALAGLFSPDDFVKNDIDKFILQKLEANGLEHSPEADREVIIRRVYFDLTGIPPTLEQAESFVNDQDENAYEKVVDELLASPRYGEKWASWWLDLARYSDTRGYEKDASRNIWKYRDWVIRAFNADMPFDQFTIEQLAGDLLPDPTDDQYIATAFHRNTMNNDEGGTDDEEFRTAAVIDRVNTTFQVWQSTTFGCVQCHSHPYDPFRHEEYYKMLAFFNNASDEDTPGEYPYLRIFNQADRRKADDLIQWVATRDKDQARDVALFVKTLEPKIHAHYCDEYIDGALVDTKWVGIRNNGSCRIRKMSLDGKSRMLLSYVAYENGGSFELREGSLSGKILAVASLEKTNGMKVISVPLKKTTGTSDLYWIFRNPKIPPDYSVCLVEWFSFQNSIPESGSKEKIYLDLLNAQTDDTPITMENTPGFSRETHVFVRGNWMVKGEKVSPGVPAILNSFPAGAPVNRMGLAQWLTHESNPLTARTISNRLWEQMFGKGLVSTLEDFGTQGEPSGNLELLDFLALRLMKDHQWSLKKLIKEMVMSGTYRQDSRLNARSNERDPYNQWLSRGPRLRLTAEQLRDQALTVSGLLSDKMYGKSVMPFQPDRVWQSVYNDEYWTRSLGEDQYRRAMYTFQKRTSPYPSMLMFDGSSREVCLVQRVPTNTPLQALVTMNDPVFVEAAKVFAENFDQEISVRLKIEQAYQQTLFREIESEKLEALLSLYHSAYEKFQKNPEEAYRWLDCKSSDPAAASMAIVCLAIFNLDEFLTKE